MTRAGRASGPLSTADYLARAVYDGRPPEHPQTREDYGFNRAFTGEQEGNLLGLYFALLGPMDIPTKTIHEWRIRGVLVDEIKAAFYRLQEGTGDPYFPWFLQNEHIVALAGQPLSAKEIQDHTDAIVIRSWKFVGGSEKDSVEEIKAAIARKPAKEQRCHSLYTVLLCNWYPSPAYDLWIDFGFASCTSNREEQVLGHHYGRLITMCTFKEFCDAYRNGRLLDLFHSKGLQVNSNPRLQDLLSGTVPTYDRKSVWYLKQYVQRGDYTGEESSMDPCAMLEYGFANCMNASEKQQLKKVYKDFFNSHNGDPLALHEAAIKGNLHGFLSKIVQGIQDPKFQRLMQNGCPRPNLDLLVGPLCSRRHVSPVISERQAPVPPVISGGQAPAPPVISNMQARLFIVAVSGIILGLILMRVLPL